MGDSRQVRPTRTGLYLSVFAGVVVAVVLVFVILRFETDRDDASSFAGSERPTARPSGGSSGSGSTTPGRGGPVPCESAAGGLYCFPRATVTSVADALKVQGAKCAKDGGDLACRAGSGADGSEVSLQAASADLDQLATLSVTTVSQAAGNNDAGRERVIGQLTRATPTLLSNLLPGEAKTQGAVRTWLNRHLNKCPDGPTMIGGYKVWCDPPTRVSAGTSGQLVSKWTVSFTVDSATAIPPR
ncbi:hypothetical protein F1D05_14120 [Kribbella qitaiheensis]|uniref:Uncharacterized protein n=1 Tax=Kribbella qitaiheensis TaxID=1544730 RepID=A0A7G6WXW7_9ACTN|nr:hypothetical protein [Kribbella qitaiheensis]QNE18832.1 hypothetical protein F1D05_14120 [Kribbella qitaiheensis]